MVEFIRVDRRGDVNAGYCRLAPSVVGSCTLLTKTFTWRSGLRCMLKLFATNMISSKELGHSLYNIETHNLRSSK